VAIVVSPLKSVVIVGGGAAGWLTAGLLARKHRNGKTGLNITLLESSDIPTIGVGEGTWPTMRHTLKRIGISENDFLVKCNATFKQGAIFAGWVDGSEEDYYYHPFNAPVGYNDIDLAPYWIKQKADHGESFAQAVDYQQAIGEAGLAPKKITTPEYNIVANYAYHLDAGKLTEVLKQFCKDNLGVAQIVDTVTGVNLQDDGDIASVTTANHGDVCADFFVDCTGFSSMLLGGALGVPFVAKNNILFADHALAMHVPNASDESPILCQTMATAQEAGWIWDIGLTNRRGTGYVYSSNHTSHEEAEQTLRRYVRKSGADANDELPTRRIKINAGHREIFWKNNCVAIGLSAGFLEPLEASALVLVEVMAGMVSDRLPACREVMDTTAEHFNKEINQRWVGIIDFLKLHYVLTQRDSDEFWRDNKRPESIPDTLQSLLKRWRYHPPSEQDFAGNRELFPWLSYQFVLYGMRFETDISLIDHTLTRTAHANKLFAENVQTRKEALKALPKHRELMNKVREFGFQPL
jgi:glycine/D-amino acid oxidase-like deaminating enzyme